MAAVRKGKRTQLARDGMQTEIRLLQLGKQTMFGMMLMKAFLKWEVERECKGRETGACPGRLTMYDAADTAVHPASA